MHYFKHEQDFTVQLWYSQPDNKFFACVSEVYPFANIGIDIPESGNNIHDVLSSINKELKCHAPQTEEFSLSDEEIKRLLTDQFCFQQLNCSPTDLTDDEYLQVLGGDSDAMAMVMQALKQRTP